MVVVGVPDVETEEEESMIAAMTSASGISIAVTGTGGVVAVVEEAAGVVEFMEAVACEVAFATACAKVFRFTAALLLPAGTSWGWPGAPPCCCRMSSKLEVSLESEGGAARVVPEDEVVSGVKNPVAGEVFMLVGARG